MLREGVQANDEVLLVPSGAWVAERGPLRPGLDALAAHLRDAGAGVKIAKALCVCCPDCPSASLEHELTRPSFARVRKYPSRADAGRAFTARLKLVLAKDVRAVGAAAMSDILLDEQAAREYVAARSSAGGRATIASHGDQLGNCGRKSPTDSIDEFSRLLSSRYCFPLLRSRSLNRCNWATRGDVHGVQGYDCSDCARLHYQSVNAGEPIHDQEVDA